MHFRKPELFPTLFFIASFVVLCTLGTWQLSRLHWKEQVIADSEKARALPALGTLPQSLDGLLYRRVMLTGTFHYDHTIHLIGRQQGMNVGYYMVTPLELDDDGRIILVNRGFSPVGKESKPQGVVTVEGMLRPLREKRYFAPENVPEKNIWTYEDLDKMEAMIGKRPLPLIVEAIGTRQNDVFPIPDDGKIVFRNDHLGYAVTWFGMALVAVIMFGAYYHRKD